MDVVLGDLDRPESLAAAFDGVSKVYLLTWNGPTSRAHAHNAIEAAIRAGRPHMVRHGAYGSERSRIIRDHVGIDEALAASGLPVTTLQPTWSMQNALLGTSPVADSDTLYLPFKNGRVGMVDVRDVVDVAAEALAANGHEGAHYVLTGPTSATFHDVARALTGALGKPVTHVDVPSEAARQSFLDGGFRAWITDGYLELIEDFAQDWGDTVSPDVERVTGGPGRTRDRFARDFSSMFGGVPQPA